MGNGYGDAGSPSNSYRTATPNKKGQYSDAVLNELESQNDEQVSGILGKVRVLKDVSSAHPSHTLPYFVAKGKGDKQGIHKGHG